MSEQPKQGNLFDSEEEPNDSDLVDSESTEKTAEDEEIDTDW